MLGAGDSRSRAWCIWCLQDEDPRMSCVWILPRNIYTMVVKETLHWIPIENFGEYKAFPIFMKEYLQSHSQWNWTYFNGWKSVTNQQTTCTIYTLFSDSRQAHTGTEWGRSAAGLLLHIEWFHITYGFQNQMILFLRHKRDLSRT